MTRRLTIAYWSVVALCTIAVSCMVLPGPAGDRRQHGWDEQRGPTIPHDSFPADCSLCHVSDNWRTLRDDFTFDHAAETGVPLNGAHQTAQCLRCHNDRGPVAIFAQRSCSGCHEDPHQRELGTDCTQCHNERNWVAEGQFALHARTRFPLIGAHVGVACFRCHPGAQVNNYKRADTHCDSCHQSDLNSATNPDHRALGWIDNCQRCHSPTAWGSGGFVHSFFPLTNGHMGVACTACHTSGQFTGLSRDCSSCHLADFQATTNPNHTTAGFSMRCEDCHSTMSWGGAGFLHNSFPLTGAHQAADCAACHGSGQYAGLSHACSACHLDDYQATVNPDHAALGFPMNCEQCHATTTWQGATFNHRFNITSGPHRVYDCSECHRVPGNASIVSCTHCHEHNQTTADAKHSGVSGYIWDSSACINCHPTGRH